MLSNKENISMLDALNRAIEIAGSQTNLAEKIGLDKASTISVMVTRDGKASVKWAAKISEATGVPCHQLRPDIFPAPANDAINQAKLA